MKQNDRLQPNSLRAAGGSQSGQTLGTTFAILVAIAGLLYWHPDVRRHMFGKLAGQPPVAPPVKEAWGTDVIASGPWLENTTATASQFKHGPKGLRASDVRTGRQPVLYMPVKKELMYAMEHILDAFYRGGYLLTNDSTAPWDVMWSFQDPFDKPQFKELLGNLTESQKVNHLPGSGWFTSKWTLSQFQADLDVLPRTYQLPSQIDLWKEFIAEHPESEWIRKGQGHKGVRVINPHAGDLQNHTEGENLLVQELIRPLQIADRMWDFGVYVSITSVDPLRVYIYDDIVFRLCREPYQQDLANASLDAYVIAASYMPPWEVTALHPYIAQTPNTRQLLSMYLHDQGHDFEDTWRLVKKSIAEILLLHAPRLRGAAQNWPNEGRSFFSIYRFDFMIDPSGRPYLMEANLSPNLCSSAHPGLAKMFRRITHSHVSLQGLLPGGFNYPLYSDDDRETVAPREDSTVDCGQGCQTVSKNQSLCYDNMDEYGNCISCQTTDERTSIVRMINEHRNRQGFRRLWPATRAQREHLGLADSPKAAIEGTLLARWVEAKCQEDSSWC